MIAGEHIPSSIYQLFWISGTPSLLNWCAYCLLSAVLFLQGSSWSASRMSTGEQTGSSGNSMLVCCYTCFMHAFLLTNEHLVADFCRRSSYGNKMDMWSLLLIHSVCIKFQWFKLKLLTMSAPISTHSRLWTWNNITVNSYYHCYYAMHNHFFPWYLSLRTNSVIFINFLL